MEGFDLEISKREGFGSAANRRLRAEGLIPSVVYHRGESSVSAVVSAREFSRLAELARLSQVFSFKSSDSLLNGRAAIVRDIQKDPVTGRPIHVDFQALKDDEEISITVPLQFSGEPVGVKIDGGMLSIHLYEVEVTCLPKDIPLVIEIDIAGLRLNNHLHGEDIVLPSGVALKTPGDIPVVSVVKQKEEKVAVAEGAAEGAEGAAAAAPAADDKAAAGKEKK